MRSLLVALLVALTPSVALTQEARVPAPSIGLPLPPIGLPLPELGLPVEAARPTPATPAERPRGQRPHRQQPAIVLFGAPYAFGYEPWQLSPTPGIIAPSVSGDSAPAPLDHTGQLRLDVSPGDAQIFVDGEYVGNLLDYHGAITLDAGTHSLELRAPKHEPVTFDVRIRAGETINYRGALTPQRNASTTQPDTTTAPGDKSPATPAMFYLIPGCYLGNVPPDQVKLPPGCDLSRMTTYQPKS